jgi:hypothetical protein
MKSNCLLCGLSLAADNITDLIPYCHACYCQRNPQVFDYLKELEGMGA